MPSQALHRGWLLLAGAVLVLLGPLAAAAGAHATLLSVDPPDGARLDESPPEVRLRFNEPVSVELGGVRVVASDGSEVHDGAATVEGAEVAVALQPDLPDGTYVITYRVVSADGHPVRGGSVFGVGDVEVDAGALGRVGGTGGDRTWDVVGAVGRALAYAGTLVAAGGALFLAVVHRGAGRPRLARAVRVAALVGIIGALFTLPVQAALGTGQGPGSLLDEGVLSAVASDGVGLGVALAIAGLALLLATMGRAAWAMLVGAAVAAGSFAATGHTRAGDDAALATVADLVHLLVVASWAGGVVLLALAVRGHRAGAASAGAAAANTARAAAPAADGGTVAERPATATDPTGTAELVVRFSSLATAGVVLAGVTGVVLGWTQVRSLEGLTTTGYGLLLLAKLAAVAAVAGLGAYNHLRLVPALQRGKTRAALGQLRTSLSLEVVSFAAVVALTAVLVVVTPAKNELDPGVVEEVVTLGDAGSVQITVVPAAAGPNQIHLYTFAPDGRPATIAEEITLELSLPSAGLGPITRAPERAGPAHLQLDTGDLAIAGDWQLVLSARVDRFTQETATVEIPISG